jgi:hypothetical protein
MEYFIERRKRKYSDLPWKNNKTNRSQDGRAILNVLLSGAAVDIVILFRNNPSCILTPDNIACKIGMKAESIMSELCKLENLGLLKTKRVGYQTWFALNKTRDKQIQGQVRDYISSFGETKSTHTRSTRFHSNALTHFHTTNEPFKLDPKLLT